ncbi:VLRF1 family aeRF1-type release factor [Exiguobacterium sp. B2(2022)]|uniref:VLRF1 family aeRF1-type release factor n=1 Tax=Exiguobacterium sp. B2(2022) TaxID=2992755 RepID=UPI00237B2FC0|nr:VLRF1 family aeRF1-type release factor [Exiguobacterium sp. B2(2022)]MDE0562805.1 VLRF1 family aeRF1-type release factor [Exiguobacterium sp. B2(2022)]
MALSTELGKIKKLHNEEAGVLSLYLSTKPSERNKWEIHLKNELRRLEQEVEASGDDAKVKGFKEVRERAEREIKQNEHKLLRSIVLFAEANNGLFELHFLQLDVDNESHYGDKPNLEQIEKLDAEFPNTGILLPQMDAITVYDTRLGEVEDVTVYELDLNSDEWRRYQGRGSRGNAASSSQVDQYDSRKEKQIQRFYREIAGEIHSLRKRHGWNEMVIIGQERSASLLKDELNIEVERVVHRNLGNAEEEEVLRRAFEG